MMHPYFGFSLFSLLIFLLHQATYGLGMMDNIYCGVHNCYNVLGVKRNATKSEISKAYRSLAKLHHPDKQKSDEEKEESAERFRSVANAYEVLRDEDTRADYDFMLDNPDLTYQNYYYYYRRRMTPQVDVRVVVAVTLLVISALQYYVACQRYKQALDFLVVTPKYRTRALNKARTSGMLNEKKQKGKSKAEIKEETEMIIRQILADSVDIKGGYEKPSIFNVLLFQILFSPYTAFMYAKWYATWIWKHNICNVEYDLEEKLYLIRKHMGLSEREFTRFEDHHVDEFLRLELWKKDKHERWKQKKDEEMKAKLAENGRYKSYRRYIKNHSGDRITFDDS